MNATYIGAFHHGIGFGNKEMVVFVAGTEFGKLFVGDCEATSVLVVYSVNSNARRLVHSIDRYTKGSAGTVLALYYENLETFPTARIYERDSFIHVFGEVVSVHNRVDFKLDIVLQAKLAKFSEVFEMRTFSTADLYVGSFIKRVA